MLRGGDKASRAPPPSPWLRSLPQSLSLSVFPTRGGNPSLRRRPPLTPFSSAPFKSLQQEASPRSPLRPHQTELAGTPSPRRNRRLFAATPTGPHRRCRRRRAFPDLIEHPSRFVVSWRSFSTFSRLSPCPVTSTRSRLVCRRCSVPRRRAIAVCELAGDH